jgi:hypothetical protein
MSKITAAPVYIETREEEWKPPRRKENGSNKEVLFRVCCGWRGLKENNGGVDQVEQQEGREHKYSLSLKSRTRTALKSSTQRVEAHHTGQQRQEAGT